MRFLKYILNKLALRINLHLKLQMIKSTYLIMLSKEITQNLPYHVYVASAAFKMELVIFAGRPTDGRSDDGRILLLCCDAFLICIGTGGGKIVAFFLRISTYVLRCVCNDRILIPLLPY